MLSSPEQEIALALGEVAIVQSSIPFGGADGVAMIAPVVDVVAGVAVIILIDAVDSSRYSSGSDGRMALSLRYMSRS